MARAGRASARTSPMRRCYAPHGLFRRADWLTAALFVVHVSSPWTCALHHFQLCCFLLLLLHLLFITIPILHHHHLRHNALLCPTRYRSLPTALLYSSTPFALFGNGGYCCYYYATTITWKEWIESLDFTKWRGWTERRQQLESMLVEAEPHRHRHGHRMEWQ